MKGAMRDGGARRRQRIGLHGQYRRSRPDPHHREERSTGGQSTRTSAWLIVAGKELRELLRDVRSLILSVAVPLIMFPLLFLVLETPLERQAGSAVAQVRLGLMPGADSSQLPALLPADQPGFRGVPVDDRAALEEGEVDLILDAQGVLFFNPLSEGSAAAGAVIRSRLASDGGSVERAAADSPAGTRLSLVPDRPVPDTAALAYSLPLLLFLSALVSLLPAALDLGVGEKERLTLEPLLINAGRTAPLVIGKLTALALSGLLGTAAFLGGMLAAVRVVPLAMPGGLPDLSGVQLAVVGSVVLALVALLASAELLVSLVARSARQAQAIFLPVLLAVSGSAYLAVLSDLWQLAEWYWWLPPLNLGLLLKAVLFELELGLRAVAVLAQSVLLSAGLAGLSVRAMSAEWILRRE